MLILTVYRTILDENRKKRWNYFSMSPRNGSCVAEVSSLRSLSSDDVSATKPHRKKSCWARATDPAHRRGRRIQLLQMLVLPFIPILALIVQTANTLHDILIYRQEVSDIETQVTKNWHIFEMCNKKRNVKNTFFYDRADSLSIAYCFPYGRVIVRAL